jgi:hypothetical protein
MATHIRGWRTDELDFSPGQKLSSYRLTKTKGTVEMSEEESLSELEREFINYLRMKRGSCPDNDTLIACHEQTLPSDQAQKVAAHIQLCGTCQIAMNMLKRFDDLMAGELPEPPDWPEVEKRSRERFYAFLKQQRASQQKDEVILPPPKSREGHS